MSGVVETGAIELNLNYVDQDVYWNMLPIPRRCMQSLHDSFAPDPHGLATMAGAVRRLPSPGAPLRRSGGLVHTSDRVARHALA